MCAWTGVLFHTFSLLFQLFSFHQDRLRNAAATKIQALFRGRNVRQAIEIGRPDLLAVETAVLFKTRKQSSD